MTSARFLLAAALMATVALPAAPRAEDRSALVEGETWNQLRGDVVGEAELLDAEGSTRWRRRSAPRTRRPCRSASSKRRARRTCAA
jgi:hypothetical protein